MLQCVVNITAVFVCANRHAALAKSGAAHGFIEMPLYAGDLNDWVLPPVNDGDGDAAVAEPKSISDAQRRTVLQTALQGLAYVHSSGIIHCDIKPANIFLTTGGTAVLGDFDVSCDNATRATMATNATKAAVSGKTFDYMAPELVQAAATTRSDMFSLGVTAFDLFFRPERQDDGSIKFRRPALTEMLTTSTGASWRSHCVRTCNSQQSLPPDVAIPVDEEYANADIDVPLRSLLSNLLARDPSKRPTALEALSADFFGVALARPNRDPAFDRRECSM